jgi:spore maturation protein CgeB
VKSLRIIFVGQTVPGSRTLQRIQAMERLGHEVRVVSTNLSGDTYEDRPSVIQRIRYRLRLPVDRASANEALIREAGSSKSDMIWLERAVEIRPAILRAVKSLNPDVKLVWYAEDDMMNPVHLSRYVEQSLPLFDLWVTTKSFNAKPEEMPARGLRRALFVNNSIDPEIHRPQSVDDEMRVEFGADIGFIGTYEKERAESIRQLCLAGLAVRVWGNGWDKMTSRPDNLRVEGRPIYDLEYAKAVSATKINLCFLRKDNRDLQTCRSIEIPAIGGFMLHERNGEIMDLLAEGTEAAYFGNDDELIEACRYWLANDGAREKIARNGHDNIVRNGYRHDDRIAYILEMLYSANSETASRS